MHRLPTLGALGASEWATQYAYCHELEVHYGRWDPRSGTLGGNICKWLYWMSLPDLPANERTTGLAYLRDALGRLVRDGGMSAEDVAALVRQTGLPSEVLADVGAVATRARVTTTSPGTTGDGEELGAKFRRWADEIPWWGWTLGAFLLAALVWRRFAGERS